MDASSLKDVLAGDKPAPKLTEHEALQQEHVEKTQRIEEVKKQIESTKQYMEKKNNNNKTVSEEKMLIFKALCDQYNSLRKEHNEILQEIQAYEELINIKF